MVAEKDSTEKGTEGEKEIKAEKQPTKTTSRPPSPKSVEKPFDPYKIIKSALSTEKVIRQIEFDNKLSFVIGRKATKPQVKRAVEELFKVKVVKVNLHNSIQGQRRAYVKLSPAHLASDVSADLGMI